ncbi:exodeoxyribonuclease VII small subunit [Colwellia sp. 6M3]|jgi:exodeoxyribonuclease VII small subunit|uniref:exodeoxyribonuclease VII small subunit n=1 Tax=Colwellia sp. 6M3 TaxID=2759849 RepID=UPI0015F38F6B|nr:exodeoxyribonuclease VII small subunit [Colwellia sp. 6M3]MBA6415641.1 exodeoxyribonuclease VII small subunit [Colwellia sp. 6M3]|tara:strand:+ start:140 stop:394 length:255 start_codon:yes stop_codon:yes gene_type:complete
MARKKIENLSFEESLVELEVIVQNLEQGDLNLEDSMALFERGLHLSQHNQEKLKGAEQQINILLEKNGQATLEKFNTNETDSID